MENKQLKRWLRALEIAKCLFKDEWYHTQYLEETLISRVFAFYDSPSKKRLSYRHENRISEPGLT